MALYFMFVFRFVACLGFQKGCIGVSCGFHGVEGLRFRV